MRRFYLLINKAVVFILLLTILPFFSCQKDVVKEPANKDANNIGLLCPTCPSYFYDYEDIPSPDTICDDFSSGIWPQGLSFTEGDTVGYSQAGLYPIVLKTGAFCAFNNPEPGMYIIGPVNFEFNGNNQTAQFEIYGFENQFDQIGFEVNGKGYISLGADFPITLGDVSVDLDMDAENTGDWEYAYLKFRGKLEAIDMHGFESGIVGLCVVEEPIPPVIDKTTSVYFDDLIAYDGSISGSYPNNKTPFGYFGLQGFSMVVKFADFLGYKPTKISFVHSYVVESKPTLINAQLPGTPLIVTSLDSLGFYLSNYGYETEYYNNPSGLMWKNEWSEPSKDAVVDSIIITGPDLSTIRIGVDPDGSELRSICSILE